jgi:hypothetical protein
MGGSLVDSSPPVVDSSPPVVDSSPPVVDSSPPVGPPSFVKPAYTAPVITIRSVQVCGV